MRYPSPLPESLRGRPFTTAEARAAGVERGRLRRTDIERVAYGVYRWTGAPGGSGVTRPVGAGAGAASSPGPDAAAPGSAPSRGSGGAYSWSAPLTVGELKSLERLWRHRGRVVLSHATAARAWGIWLPRRLDQDPSLHVSRPRNMTALVTEGVTTHRCDLPRAAVRRIRLGRHEWFITTPARTWADLAGSLTDRELVILGDHIVNQDRRKAGREALERRRAALAAAAEAPSGRPQRRRLRAALEQVRFGVDSPKETEVRLALVAAGLPEPDLQIQVWDPEFSPYYPAEADLGYEEERIAMHYDSDLHGRQRQIDSDVQRNAAFERKDYTNITISSSDARNGYSRVIARVRSLLAQRRAGR